MPESKSAILVVEDDTVTRDAVGTVLDEQGCRVVLASNGSDALLALRRRPAEPGPRRHKHAQHRWFLSPGLPVVLITAHHELDAEREAQRLGASDFINNPVNLEGMLMRIAAVGDRVRERRSSK